MSNRREEITGVILAGGQSRRMGFDKAGAEIQGSPMLSRMIETLGAVTPHILLSTGLIPYSDTKIPEVPDEFPDCGPLGGIYSALKVSQSTLNLVLSCDMPFVSPSLLNYLIERAAKNNALITAPVDHGGQIQLLCAVYHKNILPVLEKQINLQELKLRALVEKVLVERIEISIEHPLYSEHAFKNVNTPEALKETRELWKSFENRGRI